MKRLAGVCFAGLFLVGLTTSHLLWSAPPEGSKQLVCHASEDEGDHVIEISVNAVPAHLNHGDCVVGSTDRSLIGKACDTTDDNNDDQCDNAP